jgi:ATP/maltotriose-dependent transcriptional regulator MalT
LHLFRVLLEVGPFDKAVTALGDAKRVVAKAGSNDATAYLHICVSALEGQTGHLDEARRHCDIAEALLERSSNAWLFACCSMNRGCIAWLQCDFDEATKCFLAARQIASRTGHAYMTLAADTCNGYTQLLMGQFEKAEQTYVMASGRPTADITSQLSSMDGLARVYLASGRLDQAERVILEIKDRLRQTESAGLIYHVRWTTITEARLLMNRGRYDEAIALSRAAEQRFAAHRDLPLSAAVHLTHAQAAALKGDFSEAARRLLRAAELGATTIRELQAEYYYACAFAAVGDEAFGARLKQRARRVWELQGVVSVRFEIENTVFQRRPPVNSANNLIITPGAAECVTSALAALHDVAEQPRLIAEEVVSIIRTLECSPHVSIIDSPTAHVTEAADLASITTGTENTRHVAVVCKIPDSPVKAKL